MMAIAHAGPECLFGHASSQHDQWLPAGPHSGNAFARLRGHVVLMGSNNCVLESEVGLVCRTFEDSTACSCC